MQDSMTQLGEALQVMLTFPFPAEVLFFPWDVFSAACAIPVLDGPFFFCQRGNSEPAYAPSECNELW